MDNKKLVLIVEDEKNIVDILRFNLQREGYRTIEAYDGEDGLNKAMTEDPVKAKDYAQLLFYQAQLMAELPLEDPYAYTELVCKLMQ